jgi:hypothetical protein
MPTPITFVAGGNDILGSYGVGVAGGFVDRDYFTFTVGAGRSYAAIIVLPGTTVAGSASFIGIEAGSQITLPPTTATAAGLLGWHLTRPASDIGNDILFLIGNPRPALGATGFAPPLGPGTYSVWIQENGVCGPGLCHYGFDFVLVPEPASSAGVLTGLALLAFVRRYRRQSRNRCRDVAIYCGAAPIRIGLETQRGARAETRGGRLFRRPIVFLLVNALSGQEHRIIGVLIRRIFPGYSQLARFDAPRCTQKVETHSGKTL